MRRALNKDCELSAKSELSSREKLKFSSRKYSEVNLDLNINLKKNESSQNNIQIHSINTNHL